jgi:hypothetical protein
MKPTKKQSDAAKLAYDQEVHLESLVQVACRRYSADQGIEVTAELKQEFRNEFLKLIEAKKAELKKLRRRPRGASPAPSSPKPSTN